MQPPRFNANMFQKAFEQYKFSVVNEITSDIRNSLHENQITALLMLKESLANNWDEKSLFEEFKF